MTKDQSYGGLILVVSVIVIVGYLFGLTKPDWQPWLIGVPVVVAVLGILGITAWIGYTMYSTPPPAPLEAELASPTNASGSSPSSNPEEKK